MPDYIYGLRCPIVGQIRYIGKSNQPQQRLYLHLHEAKKRKYDHHAARWLRKLLSLGTRPTLEILAEVPPEGDWREYEKRIIAGMIADGAALTNASVGGDGVSFISKEQEGLAKIARRAGFTPAVQRRMSESGKKSWRDPTVRENRLKGLRAVSNTPEGRAKLKKASVMRTPAGEARRMEAVKAYWADPVNRQRQADIMKSGRAKEMSVKAWAPHKASCEQ